MHFFRKSQRILTDNEAISFLRLMFCEEQQKWEFEEEPHFRSLSDEELLDYYHNKLLKKKNSDDGIFCSHNDNIIGSLGIHQYDEQYRKHIGAIGYGVDLKYRRQGIGYQLIANAKEAAVDIGLLRLECSCLPTNLPSIALLEKSGFKKEGCKTKAIFKNGAYIDQVLFGILLTSTNEDN